MEYCSAIKRNGIFLLKVASIKFKTTMLREKSWTKQIQWSNVYKTLEGDN